MSTNLTLCLLFNLLSKNPEKPLLRYANSPQTETYDEPKINIQVNYITQNGNANIAGNGTVQYMKVREDKAVIQQLKKENEMLIDIIKMLQTRDN